MTEPVLIGGEWRASVGTETFRAMNPQTREAIGPLYPISPWSEVEQALREADRAARIVAHWPGERFASFLERYADLIDANTEAICALAHEETALPVAPRLKDVELPRTTNQLRQSAAAAREGSWANATIDTKTNIRSVLGPVGPVAVFGPNNFPFAYNGVAGGDFAGAVATGNPVIGKAHTSHPATSQKLAQLALEAAHATEMPPGFVQMIYRTSHADGEKLVAHHLLGATGYTGARAAGLVLKRAADAVGKPIFLELSSVNPVFFLPGAVAQRSEELATQLVGSGLMGCGQFCTSPGVIFVVAGSASEVLIDRVVQKYRESPVGTLLGDAVARSLGKGVETLQEHGASLLTGGSIGAGPACTFQNTVLRVDGDQFLKQPEGLQTEAFGNAILFVVARSVEQLVELAEVLEGNLTGSIYSAVDGSDDAVYDGLEPVLRRRVGRLLNDKMPTGVAVVASMNHGGPFPATGNASVTAVGVPTSLRRFGQLFCYDAVRPERLPAALRDKNPNGRMWRWIDGTWTQGNVTA